MVVLPWSDNFFRPQFLISNINDPCSFKIPVLGFFLPSFPCFEDNEVVLEVYFL